MTTRRSFIQQAGLVSAGLFLAPSLIGCSESAGSTGEIGLQLYTLREYIGKDVKGVLAKVSEAGYKDVETYGYSPESHFFGVAPKDFKQILDDNGLKSSSGHYDFNEFIRSGNEDIIKAYIDGGSAIGQEYIVAPYIIEPLRQSADDYRKVAERLNRAAQMCQEGNMKLAYHNHDFEFQNHNGTTGYDILLSETDPELVKFELDLYWVVRAGKDPIAMFKQNVGRYVMWHVKDMDKAARTLNTEVGSGTIDYKPIFEQADVSGVKRIFVEQENFAMDPYESISQSSSYVKNNLL
ncbi:sugar phosphate isomerase/epimerase family protein [Pontibacter harenae]|uniref:sugar phosphate isomerase/epimerase family protein n=1 Tax=Pontibacter harenae TaxID=2894083 RepID=UPI001E62C912|nr:sugar phosphate isomerase/epimerase [Pontibacter harenae]MCC9165512.1 sugar phosphate isomerase/epimerase [Pontibacter harenae]